MTIQHVTCSSGQRGIQILSTLNDRVLYHADVKETVSDKLKMDNPTGKTLVLRFRCMSRKGFDKRFPGVSLTV